MVEGFCGTNDCFQCRNTPAAMLLSGPLQLKTPVFLSLDPEMKDALSAGVCGCGNIKLILCHKL